MCSWRHFQFNYPALQLPCIRINTGITGYSFILGTWLECEFFSLYLLSYKHGDVANCFVYIICFTVTGTGSRERNFHDKFLQKFVSYFQH